MKPTGTFWDRRFLRYVGIFALPLILIPLFECLAVAPFGSMVFDGLEIFIALPFAGVLFVMLAWPFLLFFRRFRPHALRCLVLCLVMFVSVFAGSSAGSRIRMDAFHRLAERSAPLVRAIHDYESKQGVPPAELSDLVPVFLPVIPGTGMPAYPEYRYHAGEKAAEFDGNPWVLVVFTPNGGINFDQFMYFPLQNYPEKGYGGILERIRDWAYVHE